MSESIYTLRVSRAAAGAYPTISDALAAADQLYPDAEQPVMIRGRVSRAGRDSSLACDD